MTPIIKQNKGTNCGRNFVKESNKNVPIMIATLAKETNEPFVTSTEISFNKNIVDPIIIPTTDALIPSSDR